MERQPLQHGWMQQTDDVLPCVSILCVRAGVVGLLVASAGLQSLSSVMFDASLELPLIMKEVPLPQGSRLVGMKGEEEVGGKVIPLHSN